MSFSTLPKFGNEDRSPVAPAQPPVTSAPRPKFTFGAADDSSESEAEDLDGRSDDSHPSAEPRDSGLSLGFEGMGQYRHRTVVLLCKNMKARVPGWFPVVDDPAGFGLVAADGLACTALLAPLTERLAAFPQAGLGRTWTVI
jgi:hypothetical protein